MIKNAHFKNFKSLADVEITDLGQLTVFVGPNASGKTSILEGLEIMSRLGTQRPEKFFVGRRSPDIFLRRGAEPAGLEIAVGGVWGETEDVLSLFLTREEDGTYRQKLARESDANRPPVNRARRARLGTFSYTIDTATFLRLNPEQLALPSFSREQFPQVAYDGSGLATALREMQASRPETFAEVVRLLREVVPAVKGVRTRRAPLYITKQREITVDGKAFTREEDEEVMGEEVVFDMLGADDIAAHAVSEGTLLTLGLLTVLLNDENQRLLLLDDIGQALHPRALGDLIKVLRKLMDLDQGLQIIATSHSPYLLDHLEAHEVWLTKLDQSGQTVTARLDSHKEFDAWKNEMSTGEFWSYVGEGWLDDDGEEHEEVCDE